MKRKYPVLASLITIVFSLLIIFAVWTMEKNNVKENKLEKANNQVRTILKNETDFNSIVEYVEADPERSRFMGITMVELAKNEEKYVFNFEERYPRYKAYRDMVKEMARSDYSEWVAAVISGEEKTEFEGNIFEYLSTLNDDRYLNEATKRLGEILEATGDRGFIIRSDKDAFIIGAVGLYIAQFPAADTQMAKTIIGQKIGSFIDLSNELVADIKGIPLNKLYLYLYLKYFGLQSFIDKKMQSFMAQGRVDNHGNGINWNMGVVNALISDLKTIGKGMSQNYYSLFRTGLEKDDAVYVYIALQVLKDIGFDDPALHNWLNRNYRHMENTLFKAVEGSDGRIISREVIVIADEIRGVRNAINGKADTPFEEVLRQAVLKSAKEGNFIIPRVSAAEEVQKEFFHNKSEQYTQYHVDSALVTWEQKHRLLIVIAIICLLPLLICSLIAFAKPFWNDDAPDNILAWLIFPVTGMVLFFGFWNKYDNLSGFQGMPLLAFLIIGGILFVIIMKNRLLDLPGRALWRLLLLFCGFFNGKIRRFDTSQFYYEAAHVSPEERISALIKKNDLSHTIELLKANNDYNLSTRIINNNAGFFSCVESEEMEIIFNNRLSWINWLKETKREDVLEKIRASTNQITNTGIPTALILDDNQYSGFIAGFTAFDYADVGNRQAIENIISNTFIQRCNNGNRIIPDMVIDAIDRMDIMINPSVLLALAQEETGNKASWLWNKIEQNAAKCDDPDNWFEALIVPLEPEKFQKTLNVYQLLKVINTGFSKCKNFIPVLILLTQSRVYIERVKTYSSGNEYNRIVELHKTKIEEAQKQFQKAIKSQSDEEEGSNEQ